MNALAQHIEANINSALSSIPIPERHDIYVLSLLVNATDDDPRTPTVTVGYNTSSRVIECTPAAGQHPDWPIASDADEARWNYAFWLQNALDVVCDETRDPEGAALRENWAKAGGWWYSDEEEARNFDAAMTRVEPLQREFTRLLIRAVRNLHASGAIARLFGRPIPVLIHELEYYDEIARQNEEANPAGLAQAFSLWVRGS